MKKDYYEILGVDKNASETEIKKSYRKKALQYHPDKNPGDSKAEEQFKLAAEAYDVLSNSEKRAKYDRFGHQAFEGQNGFNGHGMDMDDIFSHFGDIFGGAFGGAFGGRKRSEATVKGEDLRIRLKLTLEEVAKGVEKKIRVKRKVRAKEATYKTCSQCNGKGQVMRVTNTILGRMQSSSVCHICRGSGQVIDHRPGGTDEQGMRPEEQTVKVTIPAGVEDGIQLKISGKGNESPGNRGIPGDLLVAIEEIEHDTLKREGYNVHYDLYISFPEAVLGTHKDIPTVTGKARIKIESGTQSGKILRLKGKGVPNLNNYDTGDMLVHVNVWTPQTLSKEEKTFFEKALNDDDNFKPSPKKTDKSFFEKVKEMFLR